MNQIGIYASFKKKYKMKIFGINIVAKYIESYDDILYIIVFNKDITYFIYFLKKVLYFSFVMSKVLYFIHC